MTRHPKRLRIPGRALPIAKAYPYLFLVGIRFRINWNSKRRQASLLAVVGLDEDGRRQMLGITAGGRNRIADWHRLLEELKVGGLHGVRLFIGDRCEGLGKRLAMAFPGATYQNSMEEFRRDLLSLVPTGHLPLMEGMLDRIGAVKNWTGACQRVDQLKSELKRLELTTAAEFLDAFVWGSMNYLAFPSAHRGKLSSSCGKEAILEHMRGHFQGGGTFSVGRSSAFGELFGYTNWRQRFWANNALIPTPGIFGKERPRLFS